MFSDENGQYMGYDGKVHTVAPGHAEYANYSGWDIYRDQAQLAAMVAPQQTSDSVTSMLNDYAADGDAAEMEPRRRRVLRHGRGPGRLDHR